MRHIRLLCPASGEKQEERAHVNSTARHDAVGLLQILDLLAELLDHALELETDIGQLPVVCLGAQRIRFAVEFLGQEIEPPADRAALPHHALRLFHMGGKTVKLLAHVRPGGDQDRLLVQPIGIKPIGRFEP